MLYREIATGRDAFMSWSGDPNVVINGNRDPRPDANCIFTPAGEPSKSKRDLYRSMENYQCLFLAYFR